MSEPSALFCRVRLTRAAFDAYLRSPLTSAPAYTDWVEWLAHAEIYGRDEFMASIPLMKARRDSRVSMFIDEWLLQEGAFARSEYDDAAQTWSFGVVEFAEDYDTLVRAFAALRGIATYKDLPGTDFAIVLPYLYGAEDGLSAAMLIEQGASELAKGFSPGALADDAKLFWRTTIERAVEATSPEKAIS